MTIPLTPQISLSPSSYSASGQTITASVSVLNRPEYHGKPAITGLTTITPKIVCSRPPSGVIPFHIQVSASETTCNAGNAYRDLHYHWDFGDSTGTELFTDHATGATVNANSSQEGPEAAYLYRTPGTYTVTLTVTGKDENGTVVTASATTVRTLGLHYYWLGIATGGTFTLTFNGETTSAIAYNADSPTVQAALEALPSLDSTNVFCLRDTKTVQFIGSLAGESYTFTADFSGLTGANATQTLVTQLPSASSSVVTVSDLTGLTANYVDPTYDLGNGASDGTITRPWVTAAQFRTWYIGGSNRVTYLKRGTTLTLTADCGQSGYNTHRILPYGTGDKPIISTPSYKFSFTLSATTSILGDFVFSNIAFEATGGVELFFSSVFTNTTPQYGVCKDIVWDNCDFEYTSVSNSNASFVSMSGLTNAFGSRGRGTSGIGIWGGNIDMGNSAGTGIYLLITEYASVIGMTILGGNGNLILDHHIYPTVRAHSLFRYITFGLSIAKSYCINMNALGYWGAHRFSLIDGCDITGTSNGLDASNSNNAYNLGTGYDGHIDDMIVQFNKIHCGTVGTQKYGLLANNLKNCVIRHNDWWANLNMNIVSTDVTMPTLYLIYANRFYDAPAITVWDNQTAYFHHNIVHSPASNVGAIRYKSSATSVELWDCDYNIYYAPESTQPFYDETNAAYRTLATWQGYGNDANGSVTNPNWHSPGSGQFIKDPTVEISWPNGFTSLESSINDGTSWQSYTNGTALSIGSYLASYDTIMFRAVTDATSVDVTIGVESDSASSDTELESQSSILSFNVGQTTYLFSANGFVYVVQT